MTAWSNSETGSFIHCSNDDQWYTMGAGKDIVADSRGSDVIDGGAGDDILNAGWGTDVLVFNTGFGNDIVAKTCHLGTVSEADAARLGWKHPYSNFLVFGQGLYPEDFSWEGTVLVHRPTDDSISLTDDCFNLVFLEENPVP